MVDQLLQVAALQLVAAFPNQLHRFELASPLPAGAQQMVEMLFRSHTALMPLKTSRYMQNGLQIH